MWKSVWLVVILLSSPLFAADSSPHLPKAGEATVLLKGQTAREFFGARQQDASCRAELGQEKENYLRERRELSDLLRGNSVGKVDEDKAEAIDAQESKMRASRRSYLAKVAECGDCAVGEITSKKFSSAAQSAVWYISDGHCQLPILGTESEQLKASRLRMVDFLTHLKRYSKEDSRKPQGSPLTLSQGFYNMLEFVAVDSNTGKLLPDVDAVTSPFYAYIAVRGMQVPVFGLMAPSYFIENQFQSIEEGTAFHLTFKGVKPPPRFTRPDLYEISASQKKTGATAVMVPSVIGSWYVNQDGYLRYFTAANFGASAKFAEDIAHDILLDTITTLMERGMGEE